MSDQAVNSVSEESENTIAQANANIKAIEDFAGGLPLVEEKIKETRKNIEHATAQVTEAVTKFSTIQSDAETQASEMQTTQSVLQEKIEVAKALQESLKNISDAIQRFQKQAESDAEKVEKNAANVLNIKKECEDARAATQAVLAEATAKKNQFEADFKTLQESVAASQNTLNALSGSINAEKTAAANIAAQFQKQFSEAQEKRLNDFNAYMKASKEDMEALKVKASEEISVQQEQLEKNVGDKITEFSSRIEVALKSMEEKDRQASKLLEAVGIKTHTYNYAGVSEKEEATANRLRMGALFFMAVAITVLVAPSVIEALKVDTALAWQEIWRNMLTRLPVSLVIFIPAGYLISESSKHRSVQRENKKIELELAALPPYLELFNDGKKQDIKEQLVPKYFVGHDQEDKEQKKEETKSWIQEIVPEIVGKVLDRFPSLKSS